MAEVIWSEAALASLSEALEYISRESPSYAAALAVQVDRAATSLLEFPHRGRIVREYHDPAVREISAGKSYRLIYKPEGNVINIVAFVHVARDLAALLNEK